MDAGLSHDAGKLKDFIGFPNCDLLIGSRKDTLNVPFYRKVVSFLAARAMNYCLSKGIFNLLGPGIKDCTSGYRRYSKWAFQKIADHKLESVAFDFHMEALSIVSLQGGTIKEIPISYVFSNSSFNSKVLKLAIQFAKKLLLRKFGFSV